MLPNGQPKLEKVKSGEAIRAARKMRGISVPDLALLTGFSVNTLYRYERGEVRVTERRRRVIERALQVPIGSLRTLLVNVWKE